MRKQSYNMYFSGMDSRIKNVGRRIMGNIIHRMGYLMLFVGTLLHAQSSEKYQSEVLKITSINDNLFVHISYLNTEKYGKVGCNGTVYFNGNEAIVFDAPTNDVASSELIQWIQKDQKKKIKAVVATHFHRDCVGGLKEFHDQGITSYANEQTIELAKNRNEMVPENGFDQELKMMIGNQLTLTKYFGAGHTTDNVIGYIPGEKAIFGGCLIKGIHAGKGNLADANVTEWPKTIANIKREIPDLQIVIPGHGKNGGTELLEYTRKLFEKKKK